MSAFDLVIRSRRTVLSDGTAPGTASAPAPAAVCVAEGRIEAVLPYDARVQAAEERDVGDLALLPGLVDTHVHVNEPGRTEWEGFASATRAAALGGVTTLIDMPLNSVPPTTTVAGLAVKRSAAQGRCHVDVGFWGGAVPGGADAGDLAELHEAGVFGFKCFLADSGVPEFPPLDAAEFEAAARRIAAFGGLLIVHAEDPAHLAPHSSGTDFEAFLASRPDAAETSAVGTVLDTARRTGARVHVLHLSSAEPLPLIAAAKADGVAVTVETCPHYLVFDAGEVPEGATEYKCCPPIRSGANRDRLWEALESGLIDFVVSDHSPCTADLKRQDTGDFAAAWGGVASLQLGLPAVWTAAKERGWPLERVVDRMARRPADFAGLPGKGRIAEGCDADLVVFDPEAEFRVDARTLAHRNPVTPYDGRVLSGMVRATFLRGRETGATPRGQLLQRAFASSSGTVR